MKEITCTAEELAKTTFDSTPYKVKLVGDVGKIRIRTIFEKHKTINKPDSLELDMSDLSVSHFVQDTMKQLLSLTHLKLSKTMDTLVVSMNGCLKLKTVDIPSSVKNIWNSFNNCISLEKVYIHGDINFYLGDGGNCSFFNSEKTTFVLAKDCQTIPLILLKTNRYTIEIEKENPYFICDGDFIFSSDKKKILKFNPKNQVENVVIPASVEEIGDYCFYNNQKVKTVVLPHSVTKIGIGAFESNNIKILTEKETLSPEALMCFKKDFYISKDIDIENPQKNSLSIIRKNKEMKNIDLFDFVKQRKEIAKTINEMPFHAAQYLFYAETYDNELFIDYPFISDILDSFETFKIDRLYTKRNVVNARNIIKNRRKGGK